MTDGRQPGRGPHPAGAPGRGMGPPQATIPCPRCKKAVATTAIRCPGCGWPVVFEGKPAEDTAELDPALFVAPPHPGTADPTVQLRAAPGDVAAGPPVGPRPGEHHVPLRPHGDLAPATAHGVTLICPACRRQNPLDRMRWCAWCGAELTRIRPVHVPEPVWTEPAPRRFGWAWLVIAALIVLALLLVAGWGLVVGRPW